MRAGDPPWCGARRADRCHAAAGLAAGGRRASLPGDCGAALGRDERDRMNLKLKRTPGVYVVGFMASGKSTVGRHIARHMGWSFFDIDDEIAAAEQMSIADIFQSRGEGEFRRIESAMIRQHVRWIE